MSRLELGDWQTPVELARAVVDAIGRFVGTPATVLEPTCGEGTFLGAAAERFCEARLVGMDINPAYVERALKVVPPDRSVVSVGDFFRVDWDRELSRVAEPILVLGNPPWVTNSQMGSLGGTNLPDKRNSQQLSGYDALTGKSNFDISEWMILRLLDALQGRRAAIAVLCKSAVARRVIAHAHGRGWPLGGAMWRIDAARHFDASVDAVLWCCVLGNSGSFSSWPVFDSLDAPAASSSLAVRDGELIRNVEGVAKTGHLLGRCDPEWRSGVKHDCARIMELERGAHGWTNGLGEVADVEEDLLFPFMKSSDVAKGAHRCRRVLLLPQRALGEDTRGLEVTAPRAWRYLTAHRELLRARKSSIYRGQPDFAVFGIGEYSFAPWKVAISGLYKKLSFSVVGPLGGKPVMLDDTCYFLPFTDEKDARVAADALGSPLATEFFEARVFWDAKRPVSKGVLQKLDLARLLNDLGLPSVERRGQQRLAL